MPHLYLRMTTYSFVSLAVLFSHLFTFSCLHHFVSFFFLLSVLEHPFFPSLLARIWATHVLQPLNAASAPPTNHLDLCRCSLWQKERGVRYCLWITPFMGPRSPVHKSMTSLNRTLHESFLLYLFLDWGGVLGGFCVFDGQTEQQQPFLEQWTTDSPQEPSSLSSACKNKVGLNLGLWLWTPHAVDLLILLQTLFHNPYHSCF